VQRVLRRGVSTVYAPPAAAAPGNVPAVAPRPAGAPVPGQRRALVPALVGVPARLRALGRRLGGQLLGRLTDACRDRGVVLPGGEGGGVVLPVGVGGVGIHRRVLRRVGGAGLGQHGGG